MMINSEKSVPLDLLKKQMPSLAYAREGTDVAINYHPDAEPDAQEVIKLIKDGRRRCRCVSIGRVFHTWFYQ